MQSKTPLTLNEQIYQEACEWFVEFRSGDLNDGGRRKFDRWARKSPEHMAAYLEIAAIWDEGAKLDSEQNWDAETLMMEGAAAEATNVVRLPNPPERTDQQSRRWKFSRVRFRVAASVAAVGCALSALMLYQNLRIPSYSTMVGEQRSITLEDGSVIDINSHSKIRVRYSAHERKVELLEGQALFHVAKNRARPFFVISGTMQVRAVGTEFDVDQKLGGTVVSVVEGRVAVLLRSQGLGGESINLHNVPIIPASSDSPSIFLSAGEQALVTPVAIRKAAHPNIAIATSWIQRELEFESASLSEVAEEFNRYNKRPLIIEDPSLYDFHITGVFSSSDPASLIRFLRERPGVRVTETESEIRVSKNIS
jgi:transmembrane sensor